MIVLCIASHPDDEVIGMGGTLARLAHEGHEVHIAIVGIRHLILEAERVATILHAKELHTLNWPDQRFDSKDALDLIQRLEAMIETVDPEVVYTHHTGDLNHDHALTAKAVLTATRPKAECSVKDVYMFEIPETAGWAFNYAFRPNVFMEMTVQMPQKLDAMACYGTEMKTAPHPRSPELLAINARRWGSVVGVYHAEAFELVRSIR